MSWLLPLPRMGDRTFILSPRNASRQKLGVGSGSSISVSPDWAPDGNKFVYVSNEPGNPQIYTFDVSTGQKKRLTFSGKYNTSPSWSPKGDWIAYAAGEGGEFNIYIIKPDGSEDHALTSGGRNESPCWSPDGRMIAYSSTNRGARHSDNVFERDWGLAVYAAGRGAGIA